MANNPDKKRKKAKKAAISAFISILPILLIIIVVMAIVGFVMDLFDFGDDEEVRRGIDTARAKGIEYVSGDILETLHVTEDGLQELLTIPDPPAWRPMYEVRLPYILYIENRSVEHKEPPADARAIPSDKEGYTKYLCYEDTILYGPDLSKYALTWQDVYTVSTAIYIGERGSNVMTGEDFKEMIPFLQPSVTYYEDVQKELKRLTTGENLELMDVLGEPYQPEPEITTEETITVTTIITPTPTVAPNIPTPTVDPLLTPTETPPITPTTTPKPLPRRPWEDNKDDTPHTLMQGETGQTYAAPAEIPPTPTPAGTPEDPIPTLIPDDTEVPFPTPTEAPPEPIVITEEVTIVATIEQHYSLLLLPKEVTTWYRDYAFVYPKENTTTDTEHVLTEIDGVEYTAADLRFREAKATSAEQRYTLDRIAKYYSVDTTVLELIPEVIGKEDSPLLADSIGKLPKGPEAAYKINVTLSQASTLEEMSWPLPGDIRLSGLYGYRTPFKLPDGSYTNPWHGGWDIGGEMNAPIVSVLAGKVTGVNYAKDAGNYVTVTHENGVQTQYLHCNSIIVKVGQEVMQNEIIAYVGTTGGSTSPHLHFNLVIDGKRADPKPWLVPALMKIDEIPPLTNEKGLAYYNGLGDEWEKTHKQ